MISDNDNFGFIPVNAEDMTIVLTGNKQDYLLLKVYKKSSTYAEQNKFRSQTRLEAPLPFSRRQFRL
jgi:hypothetical protein